MTLHETTAAEYFDRASKSEHKIPQHLSGRGIIIAAGGPYVASAFVVVKMLRFFNVKLPIEIWHAGDDEIPAWAKPAFLEQENVVLRDIMKYTPDRPLKQMRGWPIKVAAFVHSSFREIMFLDADCFPVCNLEFLFDTEEFRKHRAVFWPDYKHHRMVEGAPIWDLSGLSFKNDIEFETGIFLIDKVSCWKELNLTEWLNANSHFWYKYVLGDKDTFYLAWRKLERTYFLAPPCKRVPFVLSKHFWSKGKKIVEHRTGTSKYNLPVKIGPFSCYLSPYKWRAKYKNLVDEVLQRVVTTNFKRHAKFLAELESYQSKSQKAN